MRTAPRLARVALAAALAAAVPAGAADSRFDPHGLVAPPLRPIQVAQPQRFTLPNGIVVFLLEDHTLPVVRGTAYVPASPTLVPADRTGLADIAGEAMRSGGTAKHPGDALDDRLAALGASVSTSLSGEMGHARFRCLTDNTAEVVGMFADVVRRPAFPDDKIELAKVGLRRQIAGRNDEMIPVLVRVAQQAVYGRDNPWARIPEYATVEPVTREECAGLHARVFVPERMVLAVYGDFRAADMKRLLTAAFGDWKRSGTPAPALPPEPAPPTPRLVFAPKDDVTQSGLVLTQPGYRADDPDHAALQVFEQALGGGFASRLVNRIRTQRGLAYAAGASAGADFRRPGVFNAYTLTRNDSAMTTLALLRDEVARAVAGPFTDEEFRVARDAVQNAFVFNFEEPSSALFRAAYYQVTGYPVDFLDRYQKALAAVTPAAMQEAARRKVKPDAFVVAVVGKEKDFDRPLESAGLPVERVDISIPPPPSKVAAGAASPEALTRGRAWLDRAAEAAGGRQAWGALKAVSMEQTMKVTVQGQTLDVAATMLWAFPDRQVTTQKLPMMEVRQGFDGTTGWMAAMGQVQDQPRAAAEMKEEWERSLFRLFGPAADVKVQALPEPRTVDGVRYDVAVVASESVQDLVLFFGPDGRLARMEYQGQGPQGAPAALAQTYADWQPAGAIQYPRRMTMSVDGKPFVEGTLTSIALDPAIPPDAFKKPQP